MSAVALTHPQLARFTAPRAAAIGGLVVVVAAVGAVAWHARSPAQLQPAPSDAWAAYTHRWTRLPTPPQARTGVALAWTGNELVSLGGAVPGAGRPARDGYAFDPCAGHWSHVPPAPGPGRTDAYAVWTGSDVLLVGGYGHDKQRPANVALAPATNTWRRIAKPPFPLPTHAARVWTGHSLIVWGGGRAGGSGAEYVPAANRWRLIADAPVTLKSPSAARPRRAAITGYLEVDGRRMAEFACRSISPATCRAGPFEGLERGMASRIWYLDITKHTPAPANVSVTVRFRRH